ncbi:MAG: hypothetical protein KGM92_13765, partial [Acidobacteriota bacterium]|nr:hypothetical protein [Acidobacteriota bacterium]
VARPGVTGGEGQRAKRLRPRAPVRLQPARDAGRRWVRPFRGGPPNSTAVHPPGTTSCSRAIGRAAAKSPPKEWLDLFGGDGGIDEMLARAPVTAIFATAISMMKRGKEKGLSRRIRTPAARLRDSCAPLAS